MVDPLDNLTSSEQLRRLLLREEQERIERLETRLGDEVALRDSLAPIIADVLRDAGVKDHRRLADSLAPIVLQSIRTEIHNSRDMMVDALYPITGRLVAAAVRNAFKDLVDQLNQRLDSTLSTDRWRAKFKAAVSGRSEAEILLSEGAAFEIVDLLLINRQSGLLIAQASTDSDEGGPGSHLLSSILTAIMAFVRDAMSQSSEQDLRTLHVGDVRLHLQVSPGAVLAIKTKGPPPSGFETALSETFYAFLTCWGHVLSQPDQIESQDKIALNDDLEERFQSLLKAKQSNFRQPSKKGAILLSLLAVTAVTWLGWSFYQDWVGDRLEITARSVIDQRAELKGYPIGVNYDQSVNRLMVSGLLPDRTSREALQRDLETALPDAVLAWNIGSLPEQSVDPETLLTQADLTAWQAASRQEIRDDLDRQLATLSDRFDYIERRLPSTAEAAIVTLRSWLDQQSIRFGVDSAFIDEEEADRLLQKIADRFIGSPAGLGLRVVGYSDDVGEDLINTHVSISRAALVASKLSGLGVPSDRLQVVGRGSENRVGNISGTESVNRRVEFELIYPSDEILTDGQREEP